MKIAIILTFLLTTSFIFSKAAPLHWIFDLFVNFILQYALIAFLLGVFFAFNKEWSLSALMLLIVVSCFYQVTSYKGLASTHKSPRLTVAQFNKLYSNSNYPKIMEWLHSPDNNFDVIIFEEGLAEDQDLWSQVHKIYPYQFPETTSLQGETLIFSKTPFLSASYETLTYGADAGKFIKAEINPHDFKEPVTLYATHTKVPIGARQAESRNMKLATLASYIRDDQAEYKIAVGDMNVTPYSPYFSDFIRISDLTYRHGGLWPKATWPSFFFLPILGIPLDHVFSSKNLAMIDQQTGAAMSSDHRPLISIFEKK